MRSARRRHYPLHYYSYVDLTIFVLYDFFLCFTWFLDPLLRPAANPHKKNMKIPFFKKSTKKIHKVNKVRTLMIHLYFNYDLWLFSFFYFVYWHKYFSSRQLPSNESQQTTSCWQLSEFGTISYICWVTLYYMHFLFVYSFCSWNIPVFVFSVRSCWNIFLCRDQFF